MSDDDKWLNEVKRIFEIPDDKLIIKQPEPEANNDELASLEKKRLHKRLTRKEERQWQKTRKKWIRENPPPYGGYWYCVVGGRALTDNTELLDYGALPLTLDHDIARSRDPSKRHDLTNLNEMCAYHNGKKGSRSLKQYLATKPDKQCKY